MRNVEERVAEGLGDEWSRFDHFAYYHCNKRFHVMRTDALDRFGTRLEKGFAHNEIAKLPKEAGCAQPVFSEEPPFWVVVRKR